jgi:hypothetical protein
MPRDIKPWTCRNNHILGYINWNGDGIPQLRVPQLRVLREALDMSAEHPNEVDLLGPLDGRMPIRCSICDDVQVWEISVESLVALFMSLSDKTVFAFSQRLLELSRKVVDLGDPASNPSPIHTPTPNPSPKDGEGRMES